MQLFEPDPDFVSSRQAQRNFVLALKLSFWFVAVLWAIFSVDQLLGLGLNRFGLVPRSVPGLLGLATAPLLHGSWSHLISNSVPLLVAGTGILYLYPNSSVRVVPAIYVGASLLSWFYARPSVHIGASGLIYGLLAYVFISGILRRDFRAIGASMLIWFLYSSMVWGVLPIRPGVSWELHLSGGVMGIVLAILYRHWDITPRKSYDWELEDDPEDDDGEWQRKDPD